MIDVLVIGAGPAGLAAAEICASEGLNVLVAEHKPSVGRKFLMAGKSGLNITKDVPLDALQAAVDCPPLNPALAAFDSTAVQAWAQGLGQDVFTGSSGRVFPKAMKASPLLRAWLARLANVRFETRWRWAGWEGKAVRFETIHGCETITPRATILALGGASWARLGSDGAWADLLRVEGIAISPFQPANMGVQVNWSNHMDRHFGSALKNIALISAGQRVLGEFVVSKRGLEGSLIYALSQQIRDGAPLILDLKPDLTESDIAARLTKRPRKESQSNRLRKSISLTPVQIALLQEFAPRNGVDLAPFIKALELRHDGPRPLDEAISVAGGVPFSELDGTLMLQAKPGTFCVGEMLDWEAPTGGYLITTCMATGRHAGRAVVKALSDAHT